MNKFFSYNCRLGILALGQDCKKMALKKLFIDSVCVMIVDRFFFEAETIYYLSVENSYNGMTKFCPSTNLLTNDSIANCCTVLGLAERFLEGQNFVVLSYNRTTEERYMVWALDRYVKLILKLVNILWPISKDKLENSQSGQSYNEVAFIFALHKVPNRHEV